MAKQHDPKKVLSATKVVAASPQQIFDLLADPARHSEIDGSGSVVKPRPGGPERLALGARFGMDMKIGVPYKLTNEVVDFDEPNRIAWRHVGGHIWRYILEPTDGGTRVTEEFDWNGSKSPLVLKVSGTFAKNQKSMEATLDRMSALFSS
ncbi:MAG: SRPBCC family protein [Ilumatobacteraceae bacterium]